MYQLHQREVNYYFENWRQSCQIFYEQVWIIKGSGNASRKQAKRTSVNRFLIEVQSLITENYFVQPSTKVHVLFNP